MSGPALSHGAEVTFTLTPCTNNLALVAYLSPYLYGDCDLSASLFGHQVTTPPPPPSINAIAWPIHCTVIDFIAGVQIHLLGTLILFPKLMMRCLQFQFIFNSDGDVFEDIFQSSPCRPLAPTAGWCVSVLLSAAVTSNVNLIGIITITMSSNSSKIITEIMSAL